MKSGGKLGGWLPLAAVALLAATALAGCTVTPIPTTDYVPQLREIEFWVEPMDWEIHPGATTPVWAFCARGDGVEPVWDGDCGVPGPTVRVVAGDTIRLTFRNTHAIPHTVHFHGQHPFSADMNGNGILSDTMVVNPNASLTVEWEAQPKGSFIYHCHFDTPTHMEMGMYGAFIVEDPDEPTPDVDHVAVLDEWAIPGFGGAADRGEGLLGDGMPPYNFFTINGKSFPLTQPIFADQGDHVRIHMVNAGYEFHAMHLHGYTPWSWEGVAGKEGGRITDVREIAPGQTVVLDLQADREGVWLFHDHVVPRVTAGSTAAGFGAYPRGMLTAFVVGEQYQQALLDLVPDLLGAAAGDLAGDHGDHDHAAHSPPATADPAPSEPEPPAAAPEVEVAMVDFKFAGDTLTIDAGTKVTWTNDDPAAHTVTDAAGAFDSGNIAPRSSYSRTFDAPGTFEIYCKPHAYQGDDGRWIGMVQTVVVQ